MNLTERIQSLSEWGHRVASLPSEALADLFQKAENNNRWFTKANCASALAAVLTWLQEDTLKNWSNRYPIQNESTQKSVGLVMAGNIPLVGFHDFLSVLLAGHHAKVKLSSQDEVLLPYLVHILIGIDDRWQTHFSFEDRLHDIDMLIATGSDNSARYFEYYFRTIPKIIRKNRTSVGVIMGEEHPSEFERLGQDVFSYFGLGCRNVSKVFIPENFDLNILLKSFEGFQPIINHHKYGNNYDYQRAIRLISNKKFFDNGFLLLEDSVELVSPISVLYYQPYTNLEQLKGLLADQASKIQCTVSAKGWLKGSLPFGEAQHPKVDDYSDGMDTMMFLTSQVS